MSQQNDSQGNFKYESDEPWTADDFERIAYDAVNGQWRTPEDVEEAKVWALLAISMRLAGPDRTLEA